MRHDSLRQFLGLRRAALARGPVALIFAEDGAALDVTLRYHRRIGFAEIVVFLPPHIEVGEDVADAVHRVTLDCRVPGAVVETLNAVIAAAAPGTWLYYGYNAEFLFYPFAETRRVGEMLAFHAEERRDAMLSYVVDLYADDLAAAPDAVSLDTAHLDRMGYFTQARRDPVTGQPAERQLDFFGGLRWRFEEHVPTAARRIDRIGLFRAGRGLRLAEDHRFSAPEYNTYACPWHNSLTAAVMSFRAAKALATNPGSAREIDSFMWRNSVPFAWNSRQLLDLGLMEPGQWF